MPLLFKEFIARLLSYRMNGGLRAVCPVTYGALLLAIWLSKNGEEEAEGFLPKVLYTRLRNVREDFSIPKNEKV